MNAQANAESLADFLAVVPVGDGRFRSVRNQPNRAGGLFGGQIFAQAVMAAGASTGTRLLHSAQASFLRAGGMDLPVTYQVTPIRDGRNYTARVVSAVQDGKLLLTLSASFKDTEPDLLGYRSNVQLDWPAPEELDDLHGLQTTRAGPRRVPGFTGLDVRPCDPDRFLLRAAGDRTLRTWFRARGLDGAGALEQQAALAFLSDFAVPFVALSPHADVSANAKLFTPTLNHSIWFTGHADPADWIAYRTESRWSGDGRTLTFGDLRNRAGFPIATTVQENVLREPTVAFLC